MFWEDKAPPSRNTSLPPLPCFSPTQAKSSIGASAACCGSLLKVLSSRKLEGSKSKHECNSMFRTMEIVKTVFGFPKTLYFSSKKKKYIYRIHLYGGGGECCLINYCYSAYFISYILQIACSDEHKNWKRLLNPHKAKIKSCFKLVGFSRKQLLVSQYKRHFYFAHLQPVYFLSKFTFPPPLHVWMQR